MRQILCIPVLFLAASLSALANIDSGLLSLVPAGAKIVGSVDVTQARSSEFGQYLLSKSQAEDEHFQEMVAETGFDPRRDLQQIVFETAGPSGHDQHSFAILARGTFDQQKIEALAKTKGASIQTFQGTDIIVNKDHGQQTAIGFPDIGVAVMADLETLQQIIANRSTPSVLDPDLQNKIDAVGAANDAWFVSLVGGGFLAKHIQRETDQSVQQQSRALQGVVQSSGGVKLGAMIQMSFDAITRSEKDAQSFADVVRFVTSMVQMQRQNDPRAGILASSLDGMTLENSGTSVHVAISMPEKNLEQLADLGPLMKH